jgi:CheY-like chemotaxis protein
MQGLKILLVEDNDDVRDVYTNLLVRKGCQVSAVVNGLDAMSKLEADLPDVVVTDVAMPVLDGLDLVKTIRARDDLTNLPILVMTAYGEYLHECALEMGADAAIRKPHEAAKMFDAIQGVVNLRAG